jgi:hypothetical protein
MGERTRSCCKTRSNQEENEEAEEEEEEEVCTHLLCLESNAYSLTVRSCLSQNRLNY